MITWGAYHDDQAQTPEGALDEAGPEDSRHVRFDRVSDAEKDTILAEQIAIERERKGARDPAWLNGAQEPYAVPVVKASSLDGCVRVRQYD